MPYYSNKKQTTIAYDQAPSGRINIQKWEPPFQPVKKGFGFIGIVAEDDSEEGKLQCHECGQWYEQLPTHYSVKHGMTGEQYKAKFGLFKHTALKSKRIRLIQSAVIQKLQKEKKMGIGNNLGSSPMVKGNKYAGNQKGKKHPVESQNSYGRCDLQIMTKIIELSKKLKKTPSLMEIKEEYGGGIITVMHNRYGSYVKYCREYLKMEPLRSNHNPWSRAQWREHLIEVGQNGLNEGKELTIKKLLPANEQRYIYKYFKSFGNYVDKLLK